MQDNLTVLDFAQEKGFENDLVRIIFYIAYFVSVFVLCVQSLLPNIITLFYCVCIC